MTSPSSQPEPVPAWLRLAALATPLLTVAAVYGKTASFPYVWDDMIFGSLPVYQTCRLGDVLLAPANGFEYLPVRDLTFCLDRALFGSWAGGAHLFNALLFAVAIAFAQPLYRSVFSRAPEAGVAQRAAPLAFVAALVLAAHPLQVEPVAFVTGRNALLALVFLLASLLAYARHLETGSRLGYWLSVALVPVAIFSKATAVPLPLLILVLHRFAARPGVGLRDTLRAGAPHLIVMLPIAALQLYIANSRSTLVDELGLADTLARLPRAAFIPQFYLYKFVWPFGQSIDYVLTGVRDHRIALAAAALVLAAGSAFVIVRGLRPMRLTVFLLLSYGVALLPVLNLIPSHPPVADRYAQIPLLFLAPAVALAVSRLPLRGAVAAGVATALALAALSYRQVDVWRSDERLFAHAARVDPRAINSLGNLGHVLLTRGLEEEAIDAFERRAKVDPSEARHLALAALLAQRSGDRERASRLIADAYAVKGADAFVFLTLGEVHAMRGETDEAIESYERARKKARRSAHRASRMQAVVDVANAQLRRLNLRR